MALPKISHPTFTAEIPSTKKKITLRPFLVKEEKILLMAKASEDPADVLAAVKQIVNNCVVDDKFDIDSIAIFDLEYLFIRIRASSVNNVSKLTYKDFEDEKEYTFEIDLNDIKVDFPKNVSNKIQISPESGILMKYPSASLYDDKEFLNAQDDSLFELIVRCIDKVYDGEEMYSAANHSKKDVADFLENLDVKTFESIREFLQNVPKLSHVINYKNSFGNDRKIELNTLSDFFTLR
jgi:hypothetical protein